VDFWKEYMELFDMHCHLDLMPSMTDFARDALKADIGILAVTTTPKAYKQEIVALCSYANIRVALGLHPQLVFQRYGELSLVEKYIDGAEYIGEIGLDFNNQFYESKEKQIDIFDNIIRWCSKKGGKIISIHSVRSDKAVLDILEKYRCTKQNKCILHWFSGSLTQLQRAVEIGCFFSVNSAMIKSANGRRLICGLPHEKIVVETDAPFIKEIMEARKLKTELEGVQSALTNILSDNITRSVLETSKMLLSIS
jgi:TatD DNase family protein